MSVAALIDLNISNDAKQIAEINSRTAAIKYLVCDI